MKMANSNVTKRVLANSLKELVQESLQSKMNRLPADTQEKVQTALSRMLNEGEGGMICILL